MKKLIFCLLILGLTIAILVPAKAKEVRELKIGIAVSPAVEAMPNWRSEIENGVAFASKIFEKEFGMRFVIAKVDKWALGAACVDPNCILNDLDSNFPRKGIDMMIGLVNIPGAAMGKNGGGESGAERFRRDYFIVPYPVKPNEVGMTIARDLGLLFGAVSSNNPDSLMCPDHAGKTTDEFDKQNRKILEQTRTMDLVKGVKSLSQDALEQLLKIYKKMARGSESVAVFNHLADIYLQLGRWDEAIDFADKALQSEKANPDSYEIMAEILLQKNDYGNAVRFSMEGLKYTGNLKQQARFYRKIGYSFSEQERYDLAAENYRLSVDRDPMNMDSRFGLVTAYSLIQNFAAAKKEAEALLQINPNDTLVQEMLNNINDMIESDAEIRSRPGGSDLPQENFSDDTSKTGNLMGIRRG